MDKISKAKKLHHNAIFYFYISYLLAFLILSVFFLIFVVISIIESGVNIPVMLFLLTLGFAFILIFPLILANLTYHNFSYKLEKDRIVIDKGIVVKKYISIPYARIQNIDIVRGPIMRMLGISSVKIQTAGISGRMIAEGLIPGTSQKDAFLIKDSILATVSKFSKNFSV